MATTLSIPDRRDGVSIAAQAVANAEAAIQIFRETGQAVGRCADALVTLQRERPQQKTAAESRLCAQPHPANPEKKYTLTQADDVLQIDPEYAAYKARVANVESAKREAEQLLEVTRLVAELRVAEAKHEMGVH